MRIRDILLISVLAAAAMAACAAKTIDGSGGFESDSGREGAASRGADDEGGVVGRAAPTGDRRSQLAVTDGVRIEGVSRKALDEARAELEERIASKSIAGGAHIVARNGSPE